MSNVTPIGGTTGLSVDPDDVLKAAIGKLEDVLVIGWDKENDHFYFGTSSGRFKEICWLLKNAELELNDKINEQ